MREVAIDGWGLGRSRKPSPKSVGLKSKVPAHRADETGALHERGMGSPGRAPDAPHAAHAHAHDHRQRDGAPPVLGVEKDREGEGEGVSPREALSNFGVCVNPVSLLVCSPPWAPCLPTRARNFVGRLAWQCACARCVWEVRAEGGCGSSVVLDARSRCAFARAEVDESRPRRA